LPATRSVPDRRRAVSIDWPPAGGDMNAAGREATPDRTKLQHAVRLVNVLT
jgi:hypothetical protein